MSVNLGARIMTRQNIRLYTTVSKNSYIQLILPLRQGLALGKPVFRDSGVGLFRTWK